MFVFYCLVIDSEVEGDTDNSEGNLIMRSQPTSIISMEETLIDPTQSCRSPMVTSTSLEASSESSITGSRQSVSTTSKSYGIWKQRNEVSKTEP